MRKTKNPISRGYNRHKGDTPIYERLAELPMIGDIDDMLREGMSSPDVCKFIQLGLDRLTDVKEKTLCKYLRDRRKKVLESKSMEFNERLAAIVPSRGRKVSNLSCGQYNRVQKGMDRLIELESIYLAQRDRLDAIIEKENDLGFPFEMTDRSILTAVKILEEHAKQEDMMFRRVDEGPSHEKLDIKGYSKETAEVLQKPDSRRRVISIVERLKRVKGGKEIPGVSEASGE